MQNPRSHNPIPYYLFLTIIFGVFIFLPDTIYQPALSQGDHGRDLYAFNATLNGETPYRDYLWFYGPLMPYYYAFFYKILGVSIATVLLGEIVLKILGGIVIFFIIRRLISPLWAMLCTLWFWAYYPFFFYTYNHTGGIFFILLTLYLIFRYIQDHQTKFLYFGLLAIFFLTFVKINTGICTFAAFIVSIALCDKINRILFSSRKLFYGTAIIALPLSIFLTYLLFVHNIPQECFPYIGSDQFDRKPLSYTFALFIYIIQSRVMYSLPTQLLGILVVLTTFKTASLLFPLAWSKQSQKPLFLFLLTLGVFYVLHLHEFLLSGIAYRLLWPQLFSLLMMFIILSVGIQTLSRLFQNLLTLTLLLLIVLQIIPRYQAYPLITRPEQFLSIPKAGIFVSNPPEWIKTVTQTTNFLKNHLKSNETFFALPYEPLYYYLADKPSPTWQMAFFKFSNISPDQEQQVIQDLEQKHINYIVLSNRSATTEEGLGILGGTHCVELGKYILENFKTIKKFGDMDNEPGWIWPHGIKILQRK